MMYHYHNPSILKSRYFLNNVLSRQPRFFSFKANVLNSLNKTNPRSQDEKHSKEGNSIEERVIYNSVIKHARVPSKKEENLKLIKDVYQQYKSEGPPILAMKYLQEGNDACYSTTRKYTEQNNNETGKINFPFGTYHEVSSNINNDVSSTDVNQNVKLRSSTNESSSHSYSCKTSKNNIKGWMKDYEKYSEISVKHQAEEEDDEVEDENSVTWQLNYGSPDPNQPVSKVPCGGCGALLHCQDTAIPGYLPREIFVGLREDQLSSLVCQRCHFLREYNTALSVSVNPDIYPQLLSKINSEMALIILVIDMTDFPCSIWPGIVDILGPKRPLVVVGNKIDLLQDWSKFYLEKAKLSLVKQLPPKTNILHTTLVSAKTGYGIEQLVTTLYNLWEYRGDVYLVGCTNVGKSTLFNALLQSDYCKTKAVDLTQRATTAPWPGTTLNLLKFPIMRPQGWRLATRGLRLREQGFVGEKHIQEGSSETTPQMISYINRTFSQGSTDRSNDEYWEDPFAMPKLQTLRRLRMPGSGLDPNDPIFAKSKWLYDTPGVVTPDQIINLLTINELMLTLPREPIIPRTFQVWSGQSLLIAGLGRLDYIDGPANIKMTVLSAFNLPVTICYIADMDAVYQHYLGSKVLAVPCGGEERLSHWPGLHAGSPFTLKGIGWKESSADVVLSSAGWIAVTAQKDIIIKLQAWTPNACGIHVRIPPVLPRAVAVKGPKMYDTPEYALFNRDLKSKM